MLLEKQDREVQHGGHGRTVQAKIKASRKLFSFFSDGVYSNKPVAICRELVANAIDSHVMAGKPTLPVEVTLPTELDPTFMVRDFGTGMTEDFIFDKYLVYAEGSTKDGSNEAIGGFGIGKAAVFSYVDQFSLVSVVDGVKGVYSVFIDDTGIPAITQIATTTTDEGNGVSISFPVEVDDIKTFAEAAQTALQYFNPLPKMLNGNIDEPAYNYRGKGWMLRPTSGDLAVIMGGVRYPVATVNLTSKLRGNARLSPLLSYGIDLIMPIGSCGVALSREALSYDGKTSENIEKALEGMIDDVISTFAHMFDDCDTMWEAIVKLSKETGGASATTGRGKLLAANAFWKGVKIEQTIPVRNRTNIGNCWMIEPTSYRRRRSTNVGNAKWEDVSEQHNLYPGNIETVIVDDLPLSPKSKTIRKIKIHIEDNTKQEKHTLVLRARPDNTDKKAIEDMLNNIGGPKNVIYTSDLPEPPVESTATVKVAGSAYVRPRIRMFQTTGSTDYHGNRITNLNPSWAKTYSGAVKEIEYADQPTTGIMVVMNNFDMPNGLRKLMDVGLIKWNELFFVNKADENKVKDHFEDYEKVHAQRLKAALATYPALAQRLAVHQSSLNDYTKFIKLVVDQKISLTVAQQARPFGKMVALWQDYIAPLDDLQLRLAPYVKPALPPRINPDKVVEAFKEQQGDAIILLEELRLTEPKHLALIAKNL